MRGRDGWCLAINPKFLQFGSWTGNVMLKHQHNDFPSDVCTLLHAGGAIIKVYDVTTDAYSTHTVYGNNGIISMNMDKKVRW